VQAIILAHPRQVLIKRQGLPFLIGLLQRIINHISTCPILSQGTKQNQIEQKIDFLPGNTKKREQIFRIGNKYGKKERDDKKDIFEEELGAASSLVRVASLLYMSVRTLSSHFSPIAGFLFQIVLLVCKSELGFLAFYSWKNPTISRKFTLQEGFCRFGVFISGH
jgi:hypothetical protein